MTKASAQVADEGVGLPEIQAGDAGLVLAVNGTEDGWIYTVGGGGGSGDSLSFRGVDLDLSVGTPSDGEILVYRSAGSDWVLETKPTGGAGGAVGGAGEIQLSDGVGTFTSDSIFKYLSGSDTLEVANINISTGFLLNTVPLVNTELAMLTGYGGVVAADTLHTHAGGTAIPAGNPTEIQYNADDIVMGAKSVFNFNPTSNTLTVPNITFSGTLAGTLPSHNHSTTDLTSGVFAVSRGGTGQSSLTDNYVLIGNGTNAISMVTPSTSGYILTSNGTGSMPSFQVPPALGAHTIASHSDTSATGNELETLTNGSNADSLHGHTTAAHSISSHNDTTATGSELENLTNGTNADSLHSHTGAAATAGGSNLQLQYNDATALGGMSEVTYVAGTGIAIGAGKQINFSNGYIKNDGGIAIYGGSTTGVDIGTGSGTINITSTTSPINITATTGNIKLENTTGGIDINAPSTLDIVAGGVNITTGTGGLEIDGKNIVFDTGAANDEVLTYDNGTWSSAPIPFPAETVEVFAWVKYTTSGGSCVIQGSKNVSSVTHTAVGLHRVNFSSAHPDAHYSMQMTVTPSAGSHAIYNGGKYVSGTQATTYIDVHTRGKGNSDSGDQFADLSWNSVTTFI